LLSSVPNLRRLGVYTEVTHLIPVLPLHVPVLEHLALSGWDWAHRDVDHFATVAHPNIRLLELGPTGTQPPSEEEVRSWMGSERLPKLEGMFAARALWRRIERNRREASDDSPPRTRTQSPPSSHYFFYS
jgi:hypothetical protein